MFEAVIEGRTAEMDIGSLVHGQNFSDFDLSEPKSH